MLTGAYISHVSVAFMIFAPIFGFLGDRYNRKWIMVGGLITWVAAVVGCSVIPKNVR